MLSDVDVDLLELFSEGQYNLGSMNQFAHLIEGLNEIPRPIKGEESSGVGYLTSLTTNRSSSRTGGANKFGSQVNQSVSSSKN